MMTMAVRFTAQMVAMARVGLVTARPVSPILDRVSHGDDGANRRWTWRLGIVADRLLGAAAVVLEIAMTIYRWRVRTRCPERFGALCRVLVRGRMNSCLVEFFDGWRVVTSRNYVRRCR